MPSNTTPSSIIVDSGMEPASTGDTGSGDLLGKMVGGYRVVRLLGTGGMGAVYEANNDHGSRVAIKVLHADVAADPVLRAQFERETKIVSKLDNVHIVRGFGYEVLPDGRPCLLMMFHENTSLDAVMAAQGGHLSVRDALAYGYQILGGLKAAHGAHVFHRDLKPSNVLELKERLQVDGVNVPLVKLVDFGLAHDASPRSRRLSKPLPGAVGEVEQVRAGTPAYLSPEHALDQPTDARSDLYAFGVMLFEMLTGELPFNGSDVAMMQKHINEPAPLVSTRMSGLPEGLDAFVAQLLEKDPENRPQSAGEAQRELLKFLRRVQGEQTSVGRAIPFESDQAFDTARLPKPGPAPAPTIVLGAKPATGKNWLPLLGGLGVVVIAFTAWALWPREQAAVPIEVIERKPAEVAPVVAPVVPEVKVEPVKPEPVKVAEPIVVPVVPAGEKSVRVTAPVKTSAAKQPTVTKQLAVTEKNEGRPVDTEYAGRQRKIFEASAAGKTKRGWALMEELDKALAAHDADSVDSILGKMASVLGEAHE